MYIPVYTPRGDSCNCTCEEIDVLILAHSVLHIPVGFLLSRGSLCSLASPLLTRRNLELRSLHSLLCLPACLSLRSFDLHSCLFIEVFGFMLIHRSLCFLILPSGSHPFIFSYLPRTLLIGTLLILSFRTEILFIYFSLVALSSDLSLIHI